jgi:hypothetical protein
MPTGARAATGSHRGHSDRPARPEQGQPPGTSSGWPAGGPACSWPIGPLGVISAPRNSRGLPESRSRESRPTTRRPLEPHCGCAYPPPSGSPSGPVGPSGRNSNPDFPVNRGGPSGQLLTVGLHGVPSRRRFRWPDAYVQLMPGGITSMEFPVMSRASGQAAPGAHRFSDTATGGHGTHIRGLLPGVRRSRRLSSWPVRTIRRPACLRSRLHHGMGGQSGLGRTD